MTRSAVGRDRPGDSSRSVPNPETPPADQDRDSPNRSGPELPLSAIAAQRLDRLQRETDRLSRVRPQPPAGRLSSHRRSGLSQGQAGPSLARIKERVDQLDRESLQHDRDIRHLRKDLDRLRSTVAMTRWIAISGCTASLLLGIVLVLILLRGPSSTSEKSTSSPAIPTEPPVSGANHPGSPTQPQDLDLDQLLGDGPPPIR